MSSPTTIAEVVGNFVAQKQDQIGLFYGVQDVEKVYASVKSNEPTEHDLCEARARRSFAEFALWATGLVEQYPHVQGIRIAEEFVNKLEEAHMRFTNLCTLVQLLHQHQQQQRKRTGATLEEIKEEEAAPTATPLPKPAARKPRTKTGPTVKELSQQLEALKLSMEALKKSA